MIYIIQPLLGSGGTFHGGRGWGWLPGWYDGELEYWKGKGVIRINPLMVVTAVVLVEIDEGKDLWERSFFLFFSSVIYNILLFPINMGENNKFHDVIAIKMSFSWKLALGSQPIMSFFSSTSSYYFLKTSRSPLTYHSVGLNSYSDADNSGFCGYRHFGVSKVLEWLQSCKSFVYLHKLMRDLSICATCLLSVLQAIILSPEAPVWQSSNINPHIRASVHFSPYGSTICLLVVAS